MSQFLQLVVDRSIEGQAGEIKEYLIAIEVYGRNSSYDPKTDSIVRAEASRLRAKLRDYYDAKPVNLGSDRTNSALGDTLADDITSALVDSVDSAEWKVVGRAPAVDQTGRDQMLGWLRQNLPADYVLTGSYKVGENSNVRLTLQLVNLEDGRLLWTQTYHQRVTLLAESQKELAQAGCRNHGKIAEHLRRAQAGIPPMSRLASTTHRRGSFGAVYRAGPGAKLETLSAGDSGRSGIRAGVGGPGRCQYSTHG